ncbi:MAG: hypothetical protein SGPRY_013385, partial [Prymnesium sp.]
MTESSDNPVWPVFPGEDPTRRELEEWLKAWDSAIIKATDIDAILANETPASLISISVETDLWDMVIIKEPASETNAELAQRCTHNAKVRASHRAEQLRKKEYSSKLNMLKKAFAGRIERSMRENAPGRLRALQASHSLRTDIPGAPRAYDGPAMYVELRKLLDTPGQTQRRSARWHERQWELLRDTPPLPNHCTTSQEYSEKVHTLLTIHRPNFEAVRLEGATLTDALISFMPECNAQEVRTMRRELIAAGKHTDYEEAVRRCVEVAALAQLRTTTPSSTKAAAASIVAKSNLRAAEATASARQREAAIAAKTAAAATAAAAAALGHKKGNKEQKWCRWNSCQMIRHEEAGKRLGKKVKALRPATPPTSAVPVVPVDEDDEQANGIIGRLAFSGESGFVALPCEEDLSMRQPFSTPAVPPTVYSSTAAPPSPQLSANAAGGEVDAHTAPAHHLEDEVVFPDKWYTIIGNAYEGVYCAHNITETQGIVCLGKEEGATVRMWGHGSQGQSRAYAAWEACEKDGVRDRDGGAAGCQEDVPVGKPVVMSYPAAQAAVAALSPLTPMQELRK